MNVRLCLVRSFKMNCRAVSGLCLVALCLIAGCAVTQSGTMVGNKQDQNALEITQTNRPPAQVRMIDKERGSLATEGTGTSSYLSLSGTNGLEKSATGITPRDIFWDGENFAFSSGSDVSATLFAKGLKVRIDTRGTVDVEAQTLEVNASTLASSPQEALTQQLKHWTDYLSTLDPVSAAALITEVQTWETVAPEIKDGLITFLSNIIAPGL